MFRARGFITLDLLSFGVDAYNKSVPDAIFDLLGVTGVGREYLEMQAQCPPGGCIA